MDIYLRVLKESNKSRFDSYSVRNSVSIEYHNYYLSGLSCAHFFLQPLSKELYKFCGTFKNPHTVRKE